VAWLELVAGPNLLLREALERKLAELKADLAGPAPSKLEELLVARVVAGWLQVHYADATYAQLKGNATPAQHSAMQKRQTAAQHRYLQAIKALATVRKLLKPGPSPLELAPRAMAETPGDLPSRCGRSTSPANGLAVVN
jgi:hypothetical protein